MRRWLFAASGVAILTVSAVSYRHAERVHDAEQAMADARAHAVAIAERDALAHRPDAGATP